MKSNLIFALLILISLAACNPTDELPENEMEIPEGYSLAWNDEFDEGSIDPQKWTFETGDGTDFGLPIGWGNNEKQIYTDDETNAAVISDGEESVLAITALKEGEGQYTSAKLTTNGLFSMHFGRVDVRAKLPEGQGIWPAIWMLGDNRDQIDWPGCGEIDIMEMLGHEADKVYGSLHYTDGENKKGETQAAVTAGAANFNDAYHVYSIEWTPENIRFLLDNEAYQEVAIAADMKEFLRSFYLILNVAVGGYWPGDPDESTVFPQSMYVDYVRVFTKGGFTAPEVPALDIDEETLGQNIEPSLADHAIADDFDALGNLSITSYGGGGEPQVSSSETAIDGELSLQLDYPGGNWGGAYLEMENARNLSQYNYLVFYLHKPSSLVNVEIKLESPSTNAAVFLIDYEGQEADNGFMEYRIPLSDFAGLDLSNLTIPFSFWNPINANEQFVNATVLVDKLHFAL